MTIHFFVSIQVISPYEGLSSVCGESVMVQLRPVAALFLGLFFLCLPRFIGVSPRDLLSPLSSLACVTATSLSYLRHQKKVVKWALVADSNQIEECEKERIDKFFCAMLKCWRGG